MISLESTNGLLNKAFYLACFILGDRDAALRVVTGALAKLEVAAAAQGKRLYYTPTGRTWTRRSQSDRFRNSISFSEMHLLQHLVYVESEPYEIAQEQGRGSTPAGEEDLVIHFIKHLATKTIKRNSFYVTLGLSRLLYSYTTAETMDIYHAVIQDPERVKDDYYYRSRKGVLMQELKERFGELISICRGPRGEERFQAADDQSRFTELVKECLSLFTPWHTPCLVPAGVDPISDGIPSLSYQGLKEEDQIDVNRIHAVVHPECFRRLIADLRFDAPDTRLEIPRFFYANDMINKGPHINRHNPPNLHDEEIMSIKSELDSNAARRKATHAGLLRVMVDGVEHARIDLNKTRSTRFSLDKDAELIEVRSRDGTGEELLLASHLLAYIEDGNRIQSADASITLEGGQKISIQLSPASTENGAVVNISYRETNPFRAAALFFHQLAHLVGSGPASIWSDPRVFVPALASVLLIVFFGVVMRYGHKNGRATEQNQVATTPQNGQASEPETRLTKTAADHSATSTSGQTNTSKRSNPPPQGSEADRQPRATGTIPKSNNTDRNSAQRNPDIATVPGTATETETRSVATRAAGVSLSAVKRVYIEAVGDETLGQGVRQMLGERLRASNRITLAHNRYDADALLKVTVVRSAEPESTNILVELINARGKVLWQNSGLKYKGLPADVSTTIVRDLLAAIQESKQRR